MYSVNFNNLRDQNLPRRLRTPIFMAFIGVLQSSIVKIHDEFIVFKSEKDIRLSHDGRVFSLETLLNDVFDSLERRITIIDSNLISELRIGNDDSVNKTMIGTSVSVNVTYVRNSPYYYTTDFIVQVPTIYEASEIAISDIISQYKIAGKTFEISFI